MADSPHMGADVDIAALAAHAAQRSVQALIASGRKTMTMRNKLDSSTAASRSASAGGRRAATPMAAVGTSVPSTPAAAVPSTPRSAVPCTPADAIKLGFMSPAGPAALLGAATPPQAFDPFAVPSGHDLRPAGPCPATPPPQPCDDEEESGSEGLPGTPECRGPAPSRLGELIRNRSDRVSVGTPPAKEKTSSVPNPFALTKEEFRNERTKVRAEEKETRKSLGAAQRGRSSSGGAGSNPRRLSGEDANAASPEEPVASATSLLATVAAQAEVESKAGQVKDWEPKEFGSLMMPSPPRELRSSVHAGRRASVSRDPSESRVSEAPATAAAAAALAKVVLEKVARGRPAQSGLKESNAARSASKGRDNHMDQRTKSNAAQTRSRSGSRERSPSLTVGSLADLVMASKGRAAEGPVGSFGHDFLSVPSEEMNSEPTQSSRPYSRSSPGGTKQATPAAGTQRGRSPGQKPGAKAQGSREANPGSRQAAGKSSMLRNGDDALAAAEVVARSLIADVAARSGAPKRCASRSRTTDVSSAVGSPPAKGQRATAAAAASVTPRRASAAATKRATEAEERLAQVEAARSAGEERAKRAAEELDEVRREVQALREKTDSASEGEVPQKKRRQSKGSAGLEDPLPAAKRGAPGRGRSEDSRPVGESKAKPAPRSRSVSQERTSATPEQPPRRRVSKSPADAPSPAGSVQSVQSGGRRKSLISSAQSDAQKSLLSGITRAAVHEVATRRKAGASVISASPPRQALAEPEAKRYRRRSKTPPEWTPTAGRRAASAAKQPPVSSARRASSSGKQRSPSEDKHPPPATAARRASSGGKQRSPSEDKNPPPATAARRASSGGKQRSPSEDKQPPASAARSASSGGKQRSPSEDKQPPASAARGASSGGKQRSPSEDKQPPASAARRASSGGKQRSPSEDKQPPASAARMASSSGKQRSPSEDKQPPAASARRASSGGVQRAVSAPKAAAKPKAAAQAEPVKRPRAASSDKQPPKRAAPAETTERGRSASAGKAPTPAPPAKAQRGGARAASAGKQPAVKAPPPPAKVLPQTRRRTSSGGRERAANVAATLLAAWGEIESVAAAMAFRACLGTLLTARANGCGGRGELVSVAALNRSGRAWDIGHDDEQMGGGRGVKFVGAMGAADVGTPGLLEECKFVLHERGFFGLHERRVHARSP
eukprot:CAMPEP_0203859220 /NCGR_PEP_ID=MMETSP0359-20131031/11712_1 /ASSEMBLY_ACC=CAM_ASM_000338 /TAXON_ID=268821 /ORGANISM="Scrippsiella Hangoei, Strain SHTV-5" /LENGTH=1181 /DNA_ID=CAMNT_0050776089 /DNA_START=63 /DNA_END=3606 /DNA_ORIENTATION=+